MGVESFKTALAKATNSLRERRVRSTLFAAFGVVNTLSCMTTGLQLSIESKGRMHSCHQPAYPTADWWRRAMSRVGLRDFKLEYAGGSLVFSGSKCGP